VVATGTLLSLARAWHDRAIDVLGNEVALAVVDGHPEVRRAIDAGGGHGLRGRLRVAGGLRAAGYAGSLTLPPSCSAALVARRLGAPVRAGFDGLAGRVCFTQRVARPRRGTLHLLEEYRRLVSALGREAELLSPAVRVTARAAERAVEMIGSAAYVAVAPGAEYGPAKRWPAERFAECADALAAARGWQVVVVGGRGDREACDRTTALLGPPARNLCGRTSIGELAAVLARARLVLANDSGPMHLAAAVGSPVVGIFASSEPRWTAPLGGEAVAVEPRPDCAPCYRRTCKIGYPCLTGLTSDAVRRAAERLLEGGS
jgi:heptosyltransferase-2